MVRSSSSMIRLNRLVAQVTAAEDLPPVGSLEYRKLIAGDTEFVRPGEAVTGKARDKNIVTGKRNEGARWTLPNIDKDDVRNRMASILEKYDEERDKRKEGTLKRGGTDQYPRIAELAKTDERFAKMIADPHIAQ